MINTHTPLARAICTVLAFSMTALSFPFHAFALDAKPVKPEPEKPKTLDVRVLSAKELRTNSGKLSVNPAVSGTTKTSIIKNGIDLTTGNFTTSANDLAFEGGYGIPVSVSRVYSANNGDEGPFGYGWTLSADVRQTAGGVLKSSQSASISVPTTFRERHDYDPGETSPPPGTIIEGVVAIDASGKETTVQRDADGVLTGPAWDKNVIVPEYETVKVTSGGTTSYYDVMIKNTVTTPEGTVYVYEKKGHYSDGDGMHPLGSESGARVPSNVLKVTSVTDRNGNATHYKYRTTTFTYERINGTVTEYGLDKIWMPDGSATNSSTTSTRYIQFNYGENHGGGAEPSNRISSVTDGSRVVKYYYDGADALYEVKSPGLKIIRYGYTSWEPHENATPFPLLNSIRDHRGLTTTIAYGTQTNPYGYDYPSAYKVTSPNGIQTLVGIYGVGSADIPGEVDINITPNLMEFQVRRGFVDGYSPGVLLAYGQLSYSTTQAPATATFTMKDYTAYGTGTSQGIPRLSWAKTYNALTLDLIEEARYIQPYHDTSWMSDLGVERHLKNAGYDEQRIVTKTDYNFRGNPLRQRVWEQEKSTYSASYATIDNTNVASKVYYAYWGPTKYFQQKAVKSFKSNGDPRYSFTDYFESSDTSAGKRGQVYKVYDPEHGTFALSGTAPANTPDEWDWAYEITASGTHSAEFDYDSQGRPISVKKLKTATPTYVETITSYGSGTGNYGYPSQVVEDYGSGKLNRTTTTTEYDVAGRAVEVESPRPGGGSGVRLTVTDYEPDGEVNYVDQTEASVTTRLVQYTYYPLADFTASPSEPTKVRAGMVETITDSLSGIEQLFDYVAGDPYAYVGGVGQVLAITEDRDTYDTVAEYTYTDNGERYESEFTTPNGTTKWRYTDYITVGTPESAQRAFQTLNRLNPSNGAATSEEFHYRYDTAGRLAEAAFAQTPQSEQTYSVPAATRARAHYTYAPSGRTLELAHKWDTWGGSSYSTTEFQATEYTYENWTHLRSQAKYWAWSGGNYVNGRTEDYGYDQETGYLTSANYGSGARTWGYDAAGNRTSDSAWSGTWTYNNLNMMTASPKVTSGSGTATSWEYTYDKLGNRLTRNQWYGQQDTFAQGMVWDKVSRLLRVAGPTSGAGYTYRADGMRTEKVTDVTLQYIEEEETASGAYDWNFAVNKPTTRYYYDGQMGFEEDYTVLIPNEDPFYEVTRYGLGARGIDMIAREEIEGETVTYPIYDGHGNMICTLGKSGSSYSTSTWRYYDVWGGIHSGSSAAIPDKRYCANIGHVSDDESALIYMRARYYEPWTGRFASEDPARDGWNWFVYCGNDPVQYGDPSGKFLELILAAAFEDWLQTVQGGASTAAKHWAKQKVQQITAKHTGKLLGHLAAASIEELTYGVTEGGFFLRNLNGQRGIQVHFKLIDGKISFQAPGLKKGTIPYEFFEGFKEGLSEG